MSPPLTTSTEGLRHGEAPPAPVAEIRGVTKRFGATTALRDVTLAIHPGQSRALVGRNGAGKSTFVGVLTGLTEPDTGEVRFGGAPAPRMGDRDAWQARAACVYQRPTVVPHLTVAENIFLHSQPGPGRGFVSWRETRARARAELDAWDMTLDVDALAGELPVDQRQIVEIIRALRRGSRFIILDEPTAQLEAREIQELFARIRALQDVGVTFLYISHHLSEIYEICDSVAVLRDGQLVAEGPLSEFPEERVIDAMVGEEGVRLAPPPTALARRAADGETPLLDVGPLTLAGEYEDVRFDVHAGECVGLAGLVGSGKTAVAETIAGLRRPDAGAARLAGKPLPAGDVARAIAAGVGFVPEDRHHSGFVACLPVGDNLTMSAEAIAPSGFTRGGVRRDAANELIERLSIKASAEQPASDLSGGNQQKTVLGRAMATAPRVLLLTHPTAGVDIASKAVIFDAVARAREEGTGVVMVSDELDELRQCDRVLVMFAGRVVAEFASGWDKDAMVAAIEGMERDG